MKSAILAITCLNIMFFFLHEFDAFHKGEWNMFAFLKGLRESTRYLVFLYAHILLTLFCFYFLWSTVNFNNRPLWIVINAFSVAHLTIHIAALRWKSNVFRDVHSFILIAGWGITGIVNLALAGGYA